MGRMVCRKVALRGAAWLAVQAALRLSGEQKSLT